MFFDLASSSWGEEEIAAIRHVVDSGRFTMGENVGRFEEAFAKKFGMKHALMVNSGLAINLVSWSAS